MFESKKIPPNVCWMGAVVMLHSSVFTRLDAVPDCMSNTQTVDPSGLVEG
jgi:hypothetical protein